MAENLKAFENLKENENASLSSQEKADLRKISPDDIKSQKEKVWDKSFTVDGKSMKLKDIVKSLTFDEEGEKAELKINGKKVAIGWQSELWAAIQVYAIANNKTIGRAGIDGKVGRDTVRWLQSTQNAVKADKKETVDWPKEKISWGDLVNKPFWKYIKPEKNIKLLEERGIMNPQTGCLTPTNKASYIKDKKLKFDYKFGKDTLKVEVPVNENKYHEIDPKQVAHDIIKATIDKQNEHKIDQKNQSVEDGINDFKEKNITDPLIKKWATSKGIDFTCRTYDNGRVAIFDKKQKKISYEGIKSWGFMVNNQDLLTNWKFDAGKFNAKLKEKCNAVALKEVKADLAKVEDWIRKRPFGSSSDAEKIIKKTGELVNEIDSCNSGGQLNPERARAVDLKKSAETKKFCYDELDKMDKDISELNKLGSEISSDKREKVVKTLEKYSKMTPLEQWKFARIYKMGIKSADYYNKFKKSWLTKEYQDRLRQMRAAAAKQEIEVRV